MPTSSTRRALGVDRLDPPALAVVDPGAVVVDPGDDLVADREAEPRRPRSPARRAGLRLFITSRASAFSRATSALRLATISASSPSEKERHQSRDHLLAAGLGVGARRPPARPSGRPRSPRRRGPRGSAWRPRGRVRGSWRITSSRKTGSVRATIEREEAARLDLAELGRVADQDQLGVGLAGVVDQPRQGRRVDHPGLVDQEDRVAPQRVASAAPAVELGEEAGDARGVESLRAQDVGGAPGRRRHPQPDPGAGPGLGGGDGGEGLAGACLADHDDELLATAGQPLDHRPLVGLDRRAGGEDAGDDDRVDHGVAAVRRHRPGGGERLALELPDPLGGEARTRGVSAIRDHRVERRGRRRRSPRPRRPGRRAGSLVGDRRIASRRSKWEACAVSASGDRSVRDGRRGDLAARGRGARRIVSRSRPISSAFDPPPLPQALRR